MLIGPYSKKTEESTQRQLIFRLEKLKANFITKQVMQKPHPQGRTMNLKSRQTNVGLQN